MPVSDSAELYAVLSAGGSRDEEIRGTPEDEEFEFKGAPYRLDEPAQKLELAKDVASLAESRGGIITLPVRTVQHSTLKHEEADQLAPAPLSMLDAKQVRDVIADRVFPPLDPPALIKVWEYPGDRGMMTIEVKAQAGDNKPFITLGGLDADGVPRANLFGYYKREGDGVTAVSGQWVQGLLRDGRRFRDLWPLAGLPTLPSSESALGSTEMHRNEAIGAARELKATAGIEGSPQLIAVAVPVDKAFHPPIHETDERHFFERPPQLRRMGFNIDFASDRSELTTNGGLRKVMPGVAALELTRSGVVMLALGERYLQWGMERHGGRMLNSTAVSEFITEFCRFAETLVAQNADRRVSFNVVLTELKNGRALRLPSEMPRPLAFLESGARELPSELEEVSTEWWTEDSGERAAFRLLGDIYSRFGLGASLIPFADASLERIRYSTIAEYDSE